MDGKSHLLGNGCVKVNGLHKKKAQKSPLLARGLRAHRRNPEWKAQNSTPSSSSVAAGSRARRHPWRWPPPSGCCLGRLGLSQSPRGPTARRLISTPAASRFVLPVRPPSPPPQPPPARANAVACTLLRAAACCNGSTAAAGSGGVGKGWRVFLAWYLLALDKNPIATKAITSAVLTLAGDLICQLVVDRVPELDLKGTFVFTLLGLALVGPTLHVWYLYLSKLVAITGASGSIARLLLDQFIFSPIFIGVFMSLLVTLEGNPSLVVPKLKQEWLSSVLANWQLWIPFQFLNFYFVSQKLQVLAANFVALAWNVILSFKAHKEIVAK